MATIASNVSNWARFRTAAIYALDGVAAALSLIIAINLRVEPQRAGEIIGGTPLAVPLFTVIALVTFAAFRLHRRIWRYTSVPDVLAIAEASTIVVIVNALILSIIGQIDWMPRSIPIIQWFVLVTLLSGLRMARRMAGEYLSGSYDPPRPDLSPATRQRAALIAGSEDQVEQLLRHLERRPDAEFRPVAVIDELGLHKRMRIRGVPILGAFSELDRIVERLEAEGNRPSCIIFAGEVERLRGAAMVGVVADAQRLNLEVAYPAGFAEYGTHGELAIDFRFMNVADLLGRPQTQLNPKIVSEAITGRRVLVTGAGGTIGRELVRQIAGFGPALLVLLDSNEFNLYEVDLEMEENHSDVPRIAVLCSIRQRRQTMNVFSQHRPELVFHAAALKHVPLVEQHPSAGIQTNVLGTRNVADATRRFGARAMIQVSTDKAVNPVGFMGMTKRLGELYCQALDLDGSGDPAAPRFMTVRFGNVLGSSGSLIPLFQRQLSRGGPLTVTHPDIERFFMTVHEAVQLILHSASQTMRDGGQRGRIFVLDMGRPIRIIDVAKRMIRMAGLEPDIDVPIKIVGLRPGEKLYEELFDGIEERMASNIPGIFEAEPKPVALAVLGRTFDALEHASAGGDECLCRSLTEALLAERDRAADDIITIEPPVRSKIPLHASQPAA